ncbi:MAG: hypothetical protein JXA57_19195 [Armatimonadetes bacterium]|nr:hypothetical protein [Armatimonadota bacterium]
MIEATLITDLGCEAEQSGQYDLLFATSSTPSEPERHAFMYPLSLESGGACGAPDAVTGEDVWDQDAAATFRVAVPDRKPGILSAESREQTWVDALTSTAPSRPLPTHAIQAQRIYRHAFDATATDVGRNVRQATASAAKHSAKMLEANRKMLCAEVLPALECSNALVQQAQLRSLMAERVDRFASTESRFLSRCAEAALSLSELGLVYDRVKSSLVGFTDLCAATVGSLPSELALAESAEREISRLVGEGRVREARESLRRALALFPESAHLRQWQELLAPPRVRRVKEARTPSRQREREWLKLHAHEYRGQWVALAGERLLAAGPTFGEVLAQARATGEAARALVHWIPRARASSHA